MQVSEIIPARGILIKSQYIFLPHLLLLLLFLFLFLDLLTVCVASHTSAPSVSHFLSLSLSLSHHQGAEAQSDTAAQRAQIPDTRLH